MKRPRPGNGKIKHVEAYDISRREILTTQGAKERYKNYMSDNRFITHPNIRCFVCRGELTLVCLSSEVKVAHFRHGKGKTCRVSELTGPEYIRSIASSSRKGSAEEARLLLREAVARKEALKAHMEEIGDIPILPTELIRMLEIGWRSKIFHVKDMYLGALSLHLIQLISFDYRPSQNLTRRYEARKGKSIIFLNTQDRETRFLTKVTARLPSDVSTRPDYESGGRRGKVLPRDLSMIMGKPKPWPKDDEGGEMYSPRLDALRNLSE